MQAVILAGGLGTRLRPITYQFPKPMVKINGKPFLAYQLELLKNHNITDILLLIGYLGEQIKKYFENGEKFGLNIRYSEEKTPIGTAGALKNAEKLLEKHFLLLNGDSYLPINYCSFIDRFHEKKAKGMIAVYNNKLENTAVPNNVAINNKNNIITKYSKLKTTGCRFVDAGVSIFNKDMLKLIPKNKVVSLEQEIFPKLIKDRKLQAFVTKQRFFDIGTQERIKEFEEFLAGNFYLYFKDKTILLCP